MRPRPDSTPHSLVRLVGLIAAVAALLSALLVTARSAEADPANPPLCGPAGGPSGSLVIDGWVGAERTYDAAALAALPQTTVADTFLSGGGSSSANYTGVELWRLLELPAAANGLGSLILPNDPPGPQGPSQRNDITRYSVVVTGSDCFQATFAMTEISPFFGGKPVIVATAQGAYDSGDLTPVTGALGASGFARISNPSDVRGSRRVSNIVEIRVIKAPDAASAPPASAPECSGGASDALVIDGWVSAPQSYDAAALAARPQTTVADTFLSGGGSTSANYTGVDLWRLLGLSSSSAAIGSLILPNAPGPQAPAPQRNDLTRYSVMVTGTDCFQALFSLAEISPFFGGHPVLIATAQGAYNPADLTAVTDSLGASGFARISAPNDVRGSRRVSDIAQITVFPAPTPTMSWASPAPITAGSPLDGSILNAVALADGAPVDGTFQYEPIAGTVLPAGVYTISVLFIPTGPSSLTIARSVTTLTVVAPAATGDPAPTAEPTPAPVVSPAASPELAATGGRDSLLAIIALALVATGAGLSVAARRSR